jgi:hypothetical protein
MIGWLESPFPKADAMAQSEGFMVKFNASPELVETLRSVVDQNPEAIKLKSSGPSDEPSHLRLGLAEVSTLIAVINGAVTLGKFAYSVYKHLSQHKGEQVTVQTPLRTVAILSSDAISEQRIVELLQSALRP